MKRKTITWALQGTQKGVDERIIAVFHITYLTTIEHLGLSFYSGEGWELLPKVAQSTEVRKRLKFPFQI